MEYYIKVLTKVRTDFLASCINRDDYSVNEEGEITLEEVMETAVTMKNGKSQNGRSWWSPY